MSVEPVFAQTHVIVNQAGLEASAGKVYIYIHHVELLFMLLILTF